MKMLKLLGNFFGKFLIFLALIIIFTGLFVNYGIDNIDVLAESAKTRLPQILDENRDLIAERMFEEKAINKQSLKMACLQEPEELPGDFCNKLEGLETEEEVKKVLVDEMILDMQDETKPDIQKFEQELNENLGGIGIYLNYALPLGLFIMFLGGLVIFLVERNCVSTTYLVSFETFIISGFSTVSYYFLKNLAPDNLGEVAKVLSREESARMSELASKLISALFADWIRVVVEKLFVTSLTIAIVSLCVAVVMFILKRKASETRVKKDVKSRPVKTKPKKK